MLKKFIYGVLMRNCLTRLIFGLFVVLALMTSNAEAGFMLNLEFNTNNVLPSATPNIAFFNNTGFSESALYSVSGGFLQQRTFGVNGNASYIYPNLNETGGPFTPAEDFVIEARVRVLQINGEGGAYFQAFNGVHQLASYFRPDGVRLLTSTGPVTVSVDVFSFHTYRLESPANSNSIRLLIDGNLAFSGTPLSATGLNGFDFGDGVTAAGNGSNVDYDYIRVSSRAPVSTVPAPPNVLLLATGIGMLPVLRRRGRATARAAEPSSMS